MVLIFTADYPASPRSPVVHTFVRVVSIENNDDWTAVVALLQQLVKMQYIVALDPNGDTGNEEPVPATNLCLVWSEWCRKAGLNHHY